MQTILTIFGVIIFFGLAEAVLRRMRLDAEYVRKIGHLGVCVIVFFLPYVYLPRTIVILCLAFLGLLVLSRYFEFLPGIRKHQVDRATLGEFYLPISVGLSALLFLPAHLLAFQFGVLVLGLSDTLAEIIGLRLGRHKIRYMGKKTWQGTGAFLLATIVIFVLLIKGNFFLGLSISLLLTFAESILSFGLDNLILPILASYLISVLIH